jgi:hypothetical protein
MILNCLVIFSQIDTSGFVFETFTRQDAYRILNYKHNEFLDPKTAKFDSISAYKKMPWTIIGIYNFLKNKKDIIYEVQELNLNTNIIRSNYLRGFKIHIDNKEIEAKSYDYSYNKYIKRLEPTFERIGGELVKFSPVQHPIMKLKKTSKDESLKFMPFIPLEVFRILDKEEAIKINNQEYQCVQVEGFDELFPGDLWKYWMDADKPGVIVKAIKENNDTRYTWILKEIK